MPDRGKLAILDSGGWRRSRCWAKCWACDRRSHERKPSVVNDIWICRVCEITWQTRHRGEP